MHAAKIDEIYTEHEKDLVRNFIQSYLNDDDVTKILKQAEEIAKAKLKDLNAFDIKEATKIICGSARSMGIEVKE